MNRISPLRPPQLRRQRKRWLAIAIGAFAVIGIAYGALLGAGAALRAVDRRRLRQRQRRADHAADLGHRRRDRRRRHAVRQGRTDAGAARPGRREGRARPGRSAARARRCAKCAACSPPARSCRASIDMRQAELATRRIDDLARRERLASSGAISGEELQHAREALSGRARRRCSARSSSSQPIARASIARRSTNHPDVQNAAAHVRDAYLAVCAHRAAGAGLRLRRQARGAARPAREPGRAADGDRAARPGLGRRQFQGAAARGDARRPAGDAARRHLRRQGRLSRHGRRLRRRHRLGVRAAAGAERDRQLDQDRAARSGAHRDSTRRSSPRIRCRSACRCRSKSIRGNAQAIGCRSSASRAQAVRDRRVPLARTTSPTRASRRSSPPTSAARRMPPAQRCASATRRARNVRFEHACPESRTRRRRERTPALGTRDVGRNTARGTWPAHAARASAPRRGRAAADRQRAGAGHDRACRWRRS